MRVHTVVFLPFLAIVLALTAGLWLSSESDTTSGAQEIGAAGNPETPCEKLERLKRRLANFEVKSGGQHKEFIRLQERIEDLEIECDEFDEDGLGGVVPQGVGAAGLIANVHVSADPSTNFVAVDGTYDPLTDTITATGMGTVAGFENVSVELEMTITDDGEITGTYTMGANGELPGGEPAVYDITGEALEDTPTPTPTAEPTITPTEPPPTYTPFPTDTGGAGQLLTFGNLDCNPTGINSRDNQALLRNVLSQAALGQTEPCPDIATSVGITLPAGGQTIAWGDLDCNGQISSRDNQALLRNVLSQAALGQTEPCPDIGTQVMVTVPD